MSSVGLWGGHVNQQHFGGFAGELYRGGFPGVEARATRTGPGNGIAWPVSLRGRLVCGDGDLDRLLLEGGHYLGGEEF